MCPLCDINVTMGGVADTQTRQMQAMSQFLHQMQERGVLSLSVRLTASSMGHICNEEILARFIEMKYYICLTDFVYCRKLQR